MPCKYSLYVTNIERSIAKIYMSHFAPGPSQAIVESTLACGITIVPRKCTVPPSHELLFSHV